ncbi:MAG: alpha/beta hydrolase [Galbitalea sp.]
MVDGHELHTPDGRTVRFYDTGEQTGSTRTVFWHHGTPQSGRLLEPVVRAAAERGIRVVSCARPGYEGSTVLSDRSVAAASADVIRVADELGIGRFASVGASGGGPHALGCAALAPDRVDAVVTFAGIAPFTRDFDWFDGMADPRGPGAALEGRKARAVHAETAEFTPASFIAADWQALSGDWKSLGADAQAAGARGIDGEVEDDVAFVTPWGFDLADLGCPVLLVQGGEDRVVPAAHARWMLPQLRNGQLWFRPRDGHISVLAAYPVALDWLPNPR